MGGLSFGYMVIAILILLLLGFAVSFAFYGKEVFRSEKSDREKKKKTHPKKSIRDYLAETTFTFDPEDENLLISKGNPKLMIRLITGDSRDSISFGFNFPHKYWEDAEGNFKDAIPECEKLFSNHGTHKITFVKGPGAKWELFGQKLVEFIFTHYEDKYPTKIEG